MLRAVVDDESLLTRLGIATVSVGRMGNPLAVAAGGGSRSSAAAKLKCDKARCGEMAGGGGLGCSGAIFLEMAKPTDDDDDGGVPPLMRLASARVKDMLLGSRYRGCEMGSVVEPLSRLEGGVQW